MSLRGATKGDHGRCYDEYEFKDAPKAGPRRRSRGGRHLSVAEKIEIVHEVLVEKMLHKEVAASH